MITRRSTPRVVLCVVMVSSFFLLTPGALNVTRVGATTSPSGFYLVVGGSSSLGYEPTGRLTKDGALLDTPSNRGYANDVVQLEASRISLQLTKVGCPAETVASLLGEKDQCYHLPATQMSTALAFLRAHQSEIGVVSIDIGFNDVRPCLAPAQVEIGCVRDALASVKEDLPKVVATLRAAAGPAVRFVGLEYEDPFLERYVLSSNEGTYVNQTLAVMAELNRLLGSAYARANVAIANSARTFLSANNAPTRLAGFGVVPKNVAEICTYTFMCRAYPWGPDDHPNDAGYRAIAREIVRVLPTTWST